MNIATATSLLPALRSLIGQNSGEGYPIKKFLIAPSDIKKQIEYLQLYEFNKCNEHGIIIDCYRNEDLTIIVQFDVPHPEFKYQSLRDFYRKNLVTVLIF